MRTWGLLQLAEPATAPGSREIFVPRLVRRSQRAIAIGPSLPHGTESNAAAGLDQLLTWRASGRTRYLFDRKENYGQTRLSEDDEHGDCGRDACARHARRQSGAPGIPTPRAHGSSDQPELEIQQVFCRRRARREFDDSGFERVVIPHTNVRLPWHSFEDRTYEFVSIYRRRFKLLPRRLAATFSLTSRES